MKHSVNAALILCYIMNFQQKNYKYYSFELTSNRGMNKAEH